jgi:hypothetical protein
MALPRPGLRERDPVTAARGMVNATARLPPEWLTRFSLSIEELTCPIHNSRNVTSTVAIDGTGWPS